MEKIEKPITVQVVHESDRRAVFTNLGTAPTIEDAQDMAAQARETDAAAVMICEDQWVVARWDRRDGSWEKST